MGRLVFALFEFLLDLSDLLVSWRFYVVLLLTLAACAGVVAVVPQEPAHKLICIALLATGFFASFRWEMHKQLYR
jgi:hypothetical protein